MKKNFVLLTVFVFVFLLTNTSTGFGSSLPIIPAENVNLFGMDTPAGSGRHLGTPSTNIIKVTNLNDSGPGSLRDALVNQNSPKVIVFEVSGTIQLNSPIKIGGFTGDDAETKGSYITIAGQTAPSPGITIRDETLVIERNCHDILIQHIRFRIGEGGSQGADGIDALRTDNHYRVCSECNGINTPWPFCTGVGTCSWADPAGNWRPSYNIVIDHCSMSWGVDENIDTGYDNSTISNCIISEGLAKSLHGKGSHSKGLIVQAYNSGVAGGINTSIIKNLFVHNTDRNPVVMTGSSIIANNVMFDFVEAIRVDDHGLSSGDVMISIVGNYIDGTDQTSRWIYMIFGHKVASRAYIANDNYFQGSIQSDPWSVVTQDSDWGGKAGYQDVPEINKAATATDAVWPMGYTTMTAANAYTHVLSNAGARPADRDSVDTRIVAEVIASSPTSAMIDCVSKTNADCTADGEPMGCCTGSGTGNCIQNPEAGWPTLAKNTRTFTVPSNPNEVQASGYTKLEEWLHGFSRTVEGETSISPRTLMLE